MPVDNNEHQGIDDVFTDRYTVTRDNGFRFGTLCGILLVKTPCLIDFTF